MSPCTWALLLGGVAVAGGSFAAGWGVAVNRLAWRDVTELERDPAVDAAELARRRAALAVLEQQIRRARPPLDDGRKW